MQSGLCDGTTHRGPSIRNTVDRDVCRRRIIQLLERAGHHHDRLTEAMLCRNQVPATYTVAAENRPRVIEHVKYGTTRHPANTCHISSFNIPLLQNCSHFFAACVVSVALPVRTLTNPSSGSG